MVENGSLCTFAGSSLKKRIRVVGEWLVEFFALDSNPPPVNVPGDLRIQAICEFSNCLANLQVAWASTHDAIKMAAFLVFFRNPRLDDGLSEPSFRFPWVF